MVETIDRGFLSDTARDVLTLVGIVLAIIPLLPLKRFTPPATTAIAVKPIVRHPWRLSLLPIVLAITIPVDLVGWVFRQGSVGEAIFVLQAFLSYFFAVGVLISVSEILASYNYSIRIFLLLGCSLGALIAVFGAAASAFGDDPTGIPQLSFATAMGLAIYPVLLGTTFALLFGVIRLMWRSFK